MMRNLRRNLTLTALLVAFCLNAGYVRAYQTAAPAASASPLSAAAERARAARAALQEALKAEKEESARLAAEAAAKAQADRASRMEAKRVADEEAAKVAAEKAAKLKSEQAEALAKAKAERAARIEARRVAAEEAAKVAAEKAAKLKAEQAEALAKAKADRAARLEAQRVANEEAAKVAAEAAAKAKAERAARLEAQRIANEEAAKVAAEAAAKAKAERTARLEAKRIADEEAAKVAAEAAAKAKAERAARLEAQRVANEEAAKVAAEAAAKAKAERTARLEAKRIADEEAAKAAAAELARVKAERVARLEVQRLAAEKAAQEAAEVAAKAKAERAARIEARRVAAEEAAKVAAEKAAKVKAEQAEVLAKAKAERAARLEAKRVADAEAAKVAAEAAAKAKAENAARLEAKRVADAEAAKMAAENAAKAQAERAARLEAKRLADAEAAKMAAENAAKARAERAARLEAAAQAAAEKASQAKARQAEAAAKAKAEREARIEAQRRAAEDAVRARTEAAARVKADRAAKLEADRLAKDEAARQAAIAAKEQQVRDQASLAAYAEAASPEDSGVVTAVLGSGLMLNWPEASRRIAIADETIASFNVVSPREIVVNGIKPGRTTIFVWLSGGRRLFYRLLVEHNLGPARASLREMNPGLTLESGADGDSVVLRGEVANEVAARQAKSMVEQLLPRKSQDNRETLRLINLVRYAGVVGTPEDRLAVAMAAVDPRIRVRRIQSTAEPDAAKDSYVLEGNVRDVSALVQAVVLADRQLGGNGKTVKAADDDRVTFQRSTGSNNLGSFGSGGATSGGNALQALQATEPPKSGLSAQLARGLLVTSESGRVVSFLKVDSLPQVMVAIRVLEVDRNKARRMGLDIRADGKRFSVGNYTIPSGEKLDDLRGKASALSNTGNLVGSYVDKTIAIMGAMDFMTEKQVARSVAEPNILTLSGEQASVLVGGEVPIPTTTSNQVSTSSGFFFQQFGVRLDIRPTADENGLITLEVAPSIVSPSAGLGNGNVPGFRIQRVETTARVQAGESLVLGGLLSSNESVQERGLPLLGKIPLFRWQRKSLENTELLFLITPKLIVPPSEPVRLPSLNFSNDPTAPIGTSGLDENGIPFTFKPSDASVSGTGGSCAEVHERPSNDSTLVDCIVPNTTVLVLEGKGNWRRIQVPKGVEGWVRVERLDLTKPKS